MKKSVVLLALAAALATLLSGCTTEPAEDGTGLTQLPSDSIQYHEIRIDAFSHYWETQKQNGTILSPTTIVKVLDLGDDNFLIDTLDLLDATLDKTASLPERSIGRLFFGSDSSDRRLFYKASPAPKSFTCQIVGRGKISAFSEIPEESFLRTRRTSIVDGVEEEPQAPGWHALVDASEFVYSSFECAYAPGKGFYFGSLSTDYWGEDLYLAGREIVIRY